MISLKELIEVLEGFAPKMLQESYDNSGLLIGDFGQKIEKGLITVDLTEEVIHEAISKKCDVIIAHHPIMFKGLKRITGSTADERIAAKAIKNEIAIYAYHTNIDNARSGLNQALCTKLGLTNTRILSPKQNMLRKLVTFCPTEHADKVRRALFDAGAGNIGNYDSCSFNLEGFGTFRGSEDTNPFVGEKGQVHQENEIRIETIYPYFTEDSLIKALLSAHPYEEVAYDIYHLGNSFDMAGAGMIGELLNEMTETEIEMLRHIKKVLKAPAIRHSTLLGKTIKKVAVCGGSGSFLLKEALMANADMFITGDIKYHDFFDADGKIVIVDAGHYETEWVIKELIYNILNENFSNFAGLISETNTNPVNYF